MVYINTLTVGHCLMAMIKGKIVHKRFFLDPITNLSVKKLGL